jgi:hypothetical protein
MPLHGSMMLAPAGGYSGYQIDQSAVFDGSSDYLNWTAGTATDSNRWTYSAWIKRSELGRHQSIFTAGSSASDAGYLDLLFRSDDKLQMRGAATKWRRTSQVFRDVGAYGHLVVAVDTDQATPADRIKIYWNGVQITSFDLENNPGSGNNIGVNVAGSHRIGRQHNTISGANYYFNGYMSEINFVDGQQLEPTYFGEFYNGTTAWRPIKPSGLTYGNNGFYLDFSNASNLGEDSSGNGNDLTVNGSPSQSNDSPTVNVCTYNSLQTASSVTLSNGNRTAAHGAFSSNGGTYGTIALASGRWYWETTVDALSSGAIFLGVVAAGDAEPHTTLFANGSTGYSYRSNGQKRSNSIDASYGSTYTASDVIGVALDLDNGAIWFSKNGTWQASATVGEIEAGTTTNAAYTGLSGEFVPADMNGTSGGTYTTTVSFAEDEWTYTAPTGFVALSAANLPDPTITDPGEYFNAVAYTGDGTAVGSGGNSITGVGFQSDFTWIKNRDQADSHMLFDVLRGATKVLHSNGTAVETTESETLTSFDSDGFTLGGDVEVNTNTENYISWNWKAGGAAVPNIDGTISSTVSVSVNDDAGFSIVGYTGTGSAGTVGHGQSGAPELLIVKSTSNTGNWPAYHDAIGGTGQVYLNLTNAQATSSTYWNNTAPSSETFSLGTDSDQNGSSRDYIAYCFRSIPGYSKVFSFEGNGAADGIFVYLGFRPKFILYRNADQSGNGWPIWDSVRDTTNGRIVYLGANNSNADGSATSREIDFLSNGFKTRGTSSEVNRSGNTFVGIAFAEHPFGGSNIPLGLAQ